jgi:hypothetical protein
MTSSRSVEASSVKAVDYRGIKLTVAATSVRQVYALAYRDTWISPMDQRPVGIVAICRRTTGTTLWCGCPGHDVTGGHVRHGAGVTALRGAINAHDCPRQERTLRHRLLVAATTEREP